MTIKPALHIFAALVISAFLAGCATPTPYTSNLGSSSGGYYHRKINTEAYVIGFKGNGFTDAKRAYDFARLHAAELGQELGYNYFAIEASDDLTSSEDYTANMPSTTYGSFSGNSYQGITYDNDIDYTVTKPHIVLGVRYSYKPVPRVEGKSYSIPAVIQNVRGQYQLTAAHE